MIQLPAPSEVSKFRHQSSKGGLGVDSWSVSEWVSKALKKRKSCSKAGGGIVQGGVSSGTVDLVSPRRDQLSWSAVILQHVKRGECGQALRIYEQVRESGLKSSSYTFVAALKACCILKDLGSTKQIHVEVAESGLETDVYVGTMLVDVYCKCGSLVDARCVFEKILHRNVVSWNAMILGYVHMKQGEEALQLFYRMHQEGVVPNGRTFVGALKACCSLAAVEETNGSEGALLKQRCLNEARAIHTEVVKSGYESVVFVGTTLVDVYAKCGSLVDAWRVFEHMPQRDVVSWNAMILGYAQMEEGDKALQLYTRMHEEGVAPDSRTFVGALKACSSLAPSGGGMGTDGLLVKERCLEQLRAIQLHVVQSKYLWDVFVATSLVDAFVKCGSLMDARHIFENMPHRNVVSWSAMILGYAQMEEGEEALKLYRRMQQEAVLPDDQTFVGALKACSSLAAFEEEIEADAKCVKKGSLQQVRAIHRDVVRSGSQSSIYVGNILVDVYSKCGSVLEARHVFDQMPHRSVVSWNTMILGYAQVNEGDEALKIYAQMQQEGVVPDHRTFVGAIKACGSIATSEKDNNGDRKDLRKRGLQHIRAIHSDILKSGSQSAMFVANGLVDVYAKCGSLGDARLVFEKMPHHDIISWNTLIFGYAQMEYGAEALQMYERMQVEGVVPDDITFLCTLKACSLVGDLEKGKEIHSHISRTRLDKTGSFVPAALVDMYAKCGSMDNAQVVFDVLPTRDVVTWTALLAGYAHQGESQLVLDLFQRMKQEGIRPNSITLLSVLTACSHVGLLNKGQEYFEAMSRDYGITPTIEHYTCIVDLLGRAGQLDKAMATVKAMPFQPDVALWQTVLSACQKWPNVELGRQAFQCSVSLDATDATSYILMSNIYTAAHMWKEAKEIQALRVKTCAWKKPGRSWWTDMRGIVHSFMVGHQEHPEMQHIYEKLLHLFRSMKEE